MIPFLGVRLEAMICAGFMSYQTRRVAWACFVFNYFLGEKIILIINHTLHILYGSHRMELIRRNSLDFERFVRARLQEKFRATSNDD